MIEPELLIGSVAHKELDDEYLMVMPMTFGKYRLYRCRGAETISAF